MQILTRILFAIFIIIFTLTCFEIYQAISTLTIPFDTDEADHANAAIEVYQSIKLGSLTDIWFSFKRQAFYPPLHSVFTAISYFIFGPSWSSSRIPSLFLFIASTILLGAATYNLTKNLLGALVTIVGFATSHIILINSALSMLELCGIFTVALSIYFLTKQRQNFILFCVSCFLIFIAKYNFAIMAIPGLFWLFLTPGVKPYINFKFIPALLVVTLFCAGWVFFSSPNSFLSFLTGHPSYAPMLSAENIFFEVKSWIFEYSSNFIIAAFYLVLASLGAKQITFNSVRAATGIVLFSLILLVLSTTNETRHFMVAAPGIFFLAGIGTVYSSKFIQKSALVIVASSLVMHSNNLLSLRDNVAHEMEGKNGYGRLQEFIITSATPHAPTLIIGSTDEFSMEGIQWLAAARWGMLYSKIEFDQFPFRADKDLTAQRRKRNRDYPFENLSFPKAPLQSVLDSKHYKYVVAIRKIGARDSTFEIIKELQELLKNKTVLSLKLEDREVMVYDFRQ